ncbi:MAG: PIG-L deacetylase family protein [Phycisphaerae bacterium]
MCNASDKREVLAHANHPGEGSRTSCQGLLSGARAPTRPKVLFVGPHPDDIEIGAGCSVSIYAERGFDVQCIYLTKGERGGDPDVRVKESTEACALLGVPCDHVFFGDFEDTRVPDSFDTVNFLEQFCDERTWAVFVSSPDEAHQDHRHTALCSMAAYRNVRRLLAYETPSTTAGFLPTAFVDVTGYIRRKWQALRCHRSQLAKCRTYLEYRSMRGLAGFRGRQAGVRFAEAFQTIRFVIDPSWQMGP